MGRPSRRQRMERAAGQATVNPTPARYKACIYVRKSKEDVGEDSIEVQRDMIAEYIRGHPDLELVETFSDNGWTGTNFDRPGFQSMMDFVRAKKANCIVVKDLSRLGRNYIETGRLLQSVFPFLGVRFIAINDSFDSLTAERDADGIIIALKNVLNDMYSRDLSRKVSATKAMQRERGERSGGKTPYGYRWCVDGRNQIEPDPETAPVVQRIFQCRVEGESYQKIARRLTAEGIFSPNRYRYEKGITHSETAATAKWTALTVKRILENPAYVGHTLLGAWESEMGKLRKAPESNQVLIRNSHEALIDETTFQAVQEMNAEKTRKYKEGEERNKALERTQNILGRLVYCGDCGKVMLRQHQLTRLKRTKGFYTFICRTHKIFPDQCPLKYVRETDIIEIVWTQIRKEIEAAASLQEKIRQYMRSPAGAARKEKLEKQLQELQNRLNRTRTLQDRLYPSLADNLISAADYRICSQKYKDEIAKAEAEILDLEQEISLESVKTNKWIIAYSQHQGTQELTEELAHALVERIEISDHHRISITLKYADERMALFQSLDAVEGF